MTTQRAPVGFVQEMNLKRLELKLGHGEWATYLGIDRSLWYLLRTGQKPLSMALIQRVLQEWPDRFEPFLKGAVLDWREGPAEPPGGCAHVPAAARGALREAC